MTAWRTRACNRIIIINGRLGPVSVAKDRPNKETFSDNAYGTFVPPLTRPGEFAIDAITV